MCQAETGLSTETIKAYCLRLLARREHSCIELLNKCLLKGFDRQNSLAVINELAEQGWQSNSRFAEAYARSRMQKGYGAVAIAYELSQNDIYAVNLDTIVETVAGSWLALIEQVYYKKYHYSDFNRSEWTKRYQFLLQRGFPSSLINTFYKQMNNTSNLQTTSLNSIAEH
jgi:regulatory protein